MASSVGLPWLVGLLALLGIAALTAWSGGKVDRGVAVPATVLDLQQAAAVAAAQQVRNSLQAGLQDLAQLAGGLSVAPSADLAAQVKAFSKRYHRYRSVYVLDETRRTLAWAGAQPDPAHVPQTPARAGMTDAVGVAKVAVVVQFVPFVRKDGGPGIAVGEYDLSRLAFAFDTVRPAKAWVVNGNGQVVASTEGFVAFQALDRGQLRGAAAASYEKPGVSVSQGGVDAAEVVAFAPVRDLDKPAGVPQWGLVTARDVNAIAMPQTQARDQALLLALALAVIAIVVFSWMYLTWLGPLRRLVSDTARVAEGDLTAPMQIRRHDEIGLVAASVERIRLGLIRDIAAHRHPDHTQFLRTIPEEVD